MYLSLPYGIRQATGAARGRRRARARAVVQAARAILPLRTQGAHSLRTWAPAALGAMTLACAAAAQTPRSATYHGSTWGFFQYETGGEIGTILTGQPRLHEGHPDAVITIVSRDGHPLRAQDRQLAIGLARGLCEQSGRRFNTQTQGHWLDGGRLGFQGACTRW